MPLDIHCELYHSPVICGVDEAGKGAVLGPMVIGGVAVPDSAACEGKGYNDSKKLTARRREELYEEITSEFPYVVVSISAREIDAQRTGMGMNEIVARAHAEAVTALRPESAYLDACDVNALRYERTVKSFFSVPCMVIAEHHADSTYPVVSAASIVAKVTRDRAIVELRDEFGEIGSGYPSDPVTIRFLTDYIQMEGSVPECARSSWKTISNLLEARSQASLLDF